MLRVGWVVELDDHELRESVASLRARLDPAARMHAGPDDADVVVLWADRPLPPDLARALTRPDVVVVLAGPTLTSADVDGSLAEAAGLQVAGLTPVHDIRMRRTTDVTSFSGHEHAEGDHVGRHDHVTDRVVKRVVSAESAPRVGG